MLASIARHEASFATGGIRGCRGGRDIIERDIVTAIAFLSSMAVLVGTYHR